VQLIREFTIKSAGAKFRHTIRYCESYAPNKAELEFQKYGAKKESRESSEII